MDEARSQEQSVAMRIRKLNLSALAAGLCFSLTVGCGVERLRTLGPNLQDPVPAEPVSPPRPVEPDESTYPPAVAGPEPVSLIGGVLGTAVLPARGDCKGTFTYVNFGFVSANPGATGESQGTALNDQQVVTGSSSNGFAGNFAAFRWTGPLIATHPAVFMGGSSRGTAINESGEIVGYMHVSYTDPPHAFVNRGGVMTDLGTGFGAGSSSAAFDVNEPGQIVGQHVSSQRAPIRAALWDKGVLRDLGTIDGATHGADDIKYNTDSIAYAINDQGQVVGTSFTKYSLALRAFLWTNGVMRDLGTLGSDAEATQARDINNDGQIVGSSVTPAGATHAFSWVNGVMRDLGGYPGGSWAVSINEQGSIVGYSVNASAELRAVLWEGGQLIDLNTITSHLPAGLTLRTAVAINGNCAITGTARMPGKADRAFLLIRE